MVRGAPSNLATASCRGQGIGPISLLLLQDEIFLTLGRQASARTLGVDHTRAACADEPCVGRQHWLPCPGIRIPAACNPSRASAIQNNHNKVT